VPRWRSGNRATSTGVILDVVTERAYGSGACIATVVLCLAACSSGGGKHAAATTTASSSPHASDTTTPPRCAVRAAGSSDADGTPAPGSDFPPADALPPAGTRPKTAEQAIKSALVFGVSDGRTPPASAATATEISYRSAQSAIGESMDARIAPNRCVWKVTVDATYDGFPGGGVPSKPVVTVAQAKSYSVIFDVNSGFMFEIVGGR
jgi:hypothetical protein